MSTRLDRLEPYDEGGALRVVVEAPRGASVKLKYDGNLRAFTVMRELTLGLAYPFDWVSSGPLAKDGDPPGAGAARRDLSGVVLLAGRSPSSPSSRTPRTVGAK